MSLRAAIRPIINPFINFVDEVGGILGLLVFSLGEIRRINEPDNDVIYEETIKQIYNAGVNSVPIIAVISLALGFLANFSMHTIAGNLLTTETISQVMIIVIVREFGPMLTAIVLIARSGTAISAEIGSIVVAHELESLEAIGVDPLRLITLPRILALMLSMLILNLMFDAIGIFGGLIVSGMLNPEISFLSFATSFFETFSISDVAITLVKSLVLGALVSVTSVYFGFKIVGTRSSVAESAKRGVGSGFFWVFLFNGIITAIAYLAQGMVV